jgi:hypothetical protein
MRNVKKLLIAATAIAGVTSTSANAATWTMPVNATVLIPVQANAVQPLNFGSIIAGTAGTGAITVTPGTAAAGANAATAPVIPALAYYTSQRSGAGGTGFGLAGQVYGTATNCSATVVCNPGVVQIVASPGSTIATITLPAATTTLAGGTGTAPTVLAAGWARNPAANIVMTAGALAVSYAYLNVGGTLNVATGSSGVWTANAAITIDY